MKLNRISAALFAIGMIGAAQAQTKVSDDVVKIGVLTPRWR
jgi:branched-chain amino acid transport system substrate-binding protein